MPVLHVKERQPLETIKFFKTEMIAAYELKAYLLDFGFWSVDDEFSS